MQLFQINKNVLVPIQRDSFKLEQEIHSLIEQNLDSVFGLEFVTSEFAVGQFRLDTLAFDSEAMGCCRFHGHLDKVENGAGGGTWLREGSLRKSSRLRQSG